MLQTYATRVLVDESLAWKAYYRDALTDHCVIFVMVFLQSINPEDYIIVLSISGLDLWMQKLCATEMCFC